MSFLGSIIRAIDLYGQAIQFSYKNSQFFSTKFSILVSIIVYFIVIAYFIFLLIETINRSMPQIIEFNDTYDSPPTYKMYMDYRSIFNISSAYVQVPEGEKVNSSSGQISIGFIDTRSNRFIAINPSYFFVHITSGEQEIFFDLCRRFYDFDYETFNYYQLNRTYCLYSDFFIGGDLIESNTSQGLGISINKCKNSTYSYLERSRHPDYLNLYRKYLSYLEGLDHNNDDDCTGIYDCPLNLTINLTDPSSNNTQNGTNTSNSTQSRRRLFRNLQNEINRILQSNTTNDLNSTQTNSNQTNTTSSNNTNHTSNDQNTTNSTDTQTNETNGIQVFSDNNYLSKNYLVFRTSKAFEYYTLFESELDIINPLVSQLYNTTNVTDLIPKTDQSALNPYLENLNRLLQSNQSNTTNDTSKTFNIHEVTCASDDEIKRLLSNLKMVIYFSAEKLNKTDVENPVHRYIYSYQSWIPLSIKLRHLVRYTYNILGSFTSLWPYFLSTSDQDKFYAMNIDSVVVTVEDPQVNQIDEELAYVKLGSQTFNTVYRRKYFNILDILGLVGGFSNIVLIAGLLFVYHYINLRYVESLVNEFYSLIDPDKLNRVERDFMTFIRDRSLELQMKEEDHKHESYDHVLESFFDQQAVKRINLYNQFKKESEELAEKDPSVKVDYDEIVGIQRANKNESNKDNETSNADKKSPDEEKSEDKVDLKVIREEIKRKLLSEKKTIQKFEIIYEVYKHEVYSGTKLSFVEVFVYLLCRCCMCGKLRRKFQTFSNAMKRAKVDTDFLSIIRSVQEFENIKKVFFDEEQFSLFNSLSNDKIDSETVEKRKKDSDKISKKKSIVDRKLSKMKKLDTALENLIKKDREFDEVDEKLIMELKVNKGLLKEYLENKNLEVDSNELVDNNKEGTDSKLESRMDLLDQKYKEIIKCFFDKKKKVH